MSFNIKLSKQDYFDLGRKLVNEKPAIAEELLSLQYPDPIETDPSIIQDYYRRFSKAIHECADHDPRMLFTACIIHIYIPTAYFITSDINSKRTGVINELSKLFHVDKSMTSRLVRKTIVWYKIYNDFSQQVEAIMEGLK